MFSYRIVPILFLALFIISCADGTSATDTGANNSNKSGKPPTTLISAKIKSTNEAGKFDPYFNEGIMVTLVCEDGDGDCSGTYYSIDESNPTQDKQHLFTQAIDLSDSSYLNKTITIKYFSVDAKGNLEAAINTKTYTIDSINPVVTANPAGGDYTTAQEVAFDCIDTGVGCASLYYTFQDPTKGGGFSEKAITESVLVNSSSTLWFYAEDRAGNISDSVSSATYNFVNAVSNVTGIKAVPTDSVVTISWTNPGKPIGSNLKGVLVRRNPASAGYPANPQSGDLICDVASVSVNSAATCTDNNVINGSTYNYRVFAYDDASPIVHYSSGADVQVSPADTTPPPAITSLTAQGGDRVVKLAWANTVVDVTGVMIRRSVSGYPASVTDGTYVYDGLGTINGTNREYSDNTVSNNTTYYYSAFAHDAALNYSAAAQVQVATADTISPNPVTEFQAAPLNGAISLTWTAPATDFSGVRIVRNTSAYPVSATTLASTDSVAYDGPASSVVDQGLTNNTPYYYSVFAYDVAKNYSTPVQATATPVATSVVITVPTADQNNVPVDISSLTATFSSAIQSASVTQGSVKLASISSGVSESGVVSIATAASNKLTYTIGSGPLALNAPYQALLSSSLKDSTGIPILSSDYAWNFRTIDGQWSATYQPLIDPVGLGFSKTSHDLTPKVAISSKGDAIAVWNQLAPDGLGGMKEFVYANHFNVSSGWSALKPIPISVSPALDERNQIAIAMDSFGNTVVAWRQSDLIYANKYLISSQSWVGPTRIQSDISNTGLAPSVAINDQGNVVVVWLQSDAVGVNSVYAKTLNLSDTWSTSSPAELIEWVDTTFSSATNASKPIAVMNNTGNVVVTWKQDDASGTNNIYYNRYTPGSGWDQPVTTNVHPHTALNSSGWPVGYNDGDIKMVGDTKDNLALVWFAPGNTTINSRRYTFSSSVWTNEEIISAPDTQISLMGPASIAMNKSGVAVVVWYQSIGSGSSRSQMNIYEPGTGWRGYSTFINNYGEYEVAIDENGNALVLLLDGTTLLSYRYTPELSWSSLIDRPVVGVAPVVNQSQVYSPQIAIDSKGRGVAVWDHYSFDPADAGNGYNDIRGNGFMYRAP